MATPESSTGKTIFVLAIVVGCFALLWPRVFHPMMQTAFSITKPQTNNEKSEIPRTSSGGCCDVVHDYDINNNFFARLCELVVHRQEMMGTIKGTKSQQQQQLLLLSKENRPGVTQMCREKILELCHVDVGTILTQDPQNAEYKEALEEIRNQNVSYCLRRHYEKHEKFVQLAEKMRKRRITTTLRKPAKLSPILHPAMRERGVPIATRIREPFSHKPKSEALTGPRSGPGVPGRIPVPNVKGTSSGSMGFIMPMYTVGIVVFFVYTVMKYWKNIRTTALVLFKRGEDQQPMMKAFNMDPEYRKFVLNQDYSSTGSILSYHEYLKEKEKEEKLKSKSLLEDDDQKLMFTAIEGIIAEMDDYRERIKSNEYEKLPSEEITRAEETARAKEPSPVIIETRENGIETTIIDDSVKQPSIADVQSLRDSLQAQMSLDDSDLLPTIHEDSRFAVVGVETTAVFDARASTPTPIARASTPTPIPRSPSPIPRSPTPIPRSPTPTPQFPIPSTGLESQTPTPVEEPLREIQIPQDVPNIILDTNIPSDSTLTVSESQERIQIHERNEEEENGDSREAEGEEDEEQPVIIAGKMTISLIDTQANHVESSPGSSSPSSPSGNRNLQENSFTFKDDGDSKTVDALSATKDFDILGNILLSSAGDQAPAAASEESTEMDEIIVNEEIITEETTTTIIKDELNKDDEQSEEEEETETEEEGDDDEEEVTNAVQRKPDPPRKDPPSHIQQNWL